MIKHTDALTLLRTIESDSIDMVLTDPPYYGLVPEWDNQWTGEDAYLHWCNEWFTECVRVLKPNRAICVWGTTKTDTFLRFKLEVMNRSELKYQNWIIWHYDWGGRTKKTFPRKHEDLLVYSKGTELLFNPDDVRVPYRMSNNCRPTAINNPLGKVPTDVWEKNNHTMSREYVKWHPTQKPLILLERLIRAYTNPGDTVLDIFNGSASTTIACDRSDRKFIGSEIDEYYYKKSLERREALGKIYRMVS